MTPEYARYQFFLSIFNSAFTVAAFIFAWWRTREKVSDDRFAAFGEKMVALEKKIGTVEELAKHPMVCGSHARMEETDQHVNARLDGISRLLSKIDGRLEGINRMVDLLTQNELSGGKG